MKVKFSIVRSSASGPDTSHPAPRTSSRQGIALIVTLIMLSVITFLTVTFLVLSQRERGSVTTNTDQLIAKQAAESGLERAKIEVVAPMLATANDQVADMIVSRNFINRDGFDPGSPYNHFTNVNYDYRQDGSPLIALDRLRVLTNLFYNPRPPVYMTNRVSGKTEFRYYLDLNRNGFYDTNGFTPEIGLNGLPIVTGGVTNYAWHIGDPEWIGVLERPEMPYSSSNKFIARYAYVVVPAGKTLDVNYIHNYAKRFDLGLAAGSGDGFSRNEGMGTWEINLGAFFRDLNTNTWASYSYPLTGGGVPDLAAKNTGTAFDDALSVLRYRYANNYNFLGNGLPSYAADRLDEYGDGPFMLGTALPNDVDPAVTGALWPGSDNPNHFFTLQEVFDPAKTSLLASRLRNTGTNVSSYDRYTYYRMLSQLGTDSQPDNRINVNYANVDAAGNVVPGMETNQIPWSPEGFFTTAANKLLRQHTREWWHDDLNSFTNTFGLTNAFGATNIPVFYSFINSAGGTNRYFGYTPSVHRLLQLTANIYDASAGTEGTNLIVLPPQPGGGTRTIYAPHVFRPIFRRDDANTAVYIVGYRELTNTTFITSPPVMVDLHDPVDRKKITAFGESPPIFAKEPMAYGIPLVIGAKKDLPNFNKFILENAVTATRKLNFKRVAGQGVNQTNQTYSFNITNALGVQLWNSYNSTVPRTVRLIANTQTEISVTNEFGSIAGPDGKILSRVFLAGGTNDVLAGKWLGYPSSPVGSVQVPVFTNAIFLTNADYIQTINGGGYFPGGRNLRDPNNAFPTPKLWLNLRARIQVAIVDPAANRILDYVNVDGSQAPVNIIDFMRGQNARCDGADITDGGDFWCTNRVDDPTSQNSPPRPYNPYIPTYGIINQIRASLGDPSVSDYIWKTYNARTDDKAQATDLFNQRMFDNSGATEGSLDFAAPFQPTRTFVQFIRWEVNDPLVHYTMADLTDLLINKDQNGPKFAESLTYTLYDKLKGKNPLSDRYLPWDGNPVNPAETNPKTRLNSAVKDPAMLSSDGWDFPTNKLPNIGWLGRVHRGTPWQTVYLKSDDLGSRGYTGSPSSWAALQVPLGANSAADTWVKWSGNQSYLNADAFHSRPVQDRMLFDIFTASLNDNSSRGRLSVNQTGLAAWSAVLSGVNVITNVKTGTYSFSTANVTIEPAAVSPALTRIVNGINRTRTAAAGTNAYVFPNARFAHVGDVLSTPELTFNSPYINTNNMPSKLANGLNDEIVERIPQQIMSLLDIDHSPRFVIYSYGQTLRPAPQSIIRSFGAFNGMCTNYQVTAETATRAVLRMEGSFDPRDSNNSDPLLHYPPRVVVEQYNLLPPD